jgi:DNA-binding CsgD family transcriptional regulator
MKARGTFNLFLASAVAALTLGLLNVWGRPEWFNRLPLSYALRLFQAVRAYAASCLSFFSVLALSRARGRHCEGSRYRILFAVCFAPLMSYSALTLARVDLHVLDIFMRVDSLLAWGCAAVAVVVSIFGRREGLPLYAFLFRPEIFPSLSPTQVSTLYSLSTRESEVLALLLQGKSNSQIAGSLFISLPTVKTHLAHILAKTGTRNRLEVFALCSRTPPRNESGPLR